MGFDERNRPFHGRGLAARRALRRLTVDVDDLALCRGEPEFLADKLPADDLHFRAAVPAVLLLFRKWDDLILYGHAFEKFRMRAFCLAGMLFDNSSFCLRFFVSPCLLLRFIKKAELPLHIFGFFAGCAEKLFCKVINLLIHHGHRLIV